MIRTALPALITALVYIQLPAISRDWSVQHDAAGQLHSCITHTGGCHTCHRPAGVTEAPNLNSVVYYQLCVAIPVQSVQSSVLLTVLSIRLHSPTACSAHVTVQSAAGCENPVVQITT